MAKEITTAAASALEEASTEKTVSLEKSPAGPSTSEQPIQEASPIVSKSVGKESATGESAGSKGEQEETSPPKNQVVTYTLTPARVLTQTGKRRMLAEEEEEEEEEEAKDSDVEITGTATGPGVKAATIKTRLRSRSSRKPKKARTASVEPPVHIPTEPRKVLPELFIAPGLLVNNGFGEVFDMLKAQGWKTLFDEKIDVDEDQVQKFYADFTLVCNPRSGALSGSTVVDEEQLMFSPKDISGLLQIPASGFFLPPDADLQRERAESSLRLFGKEVSNLNTNELTRLQRVAHLVIIKGVVPRLEKRTSVTGMDIILLDKFMHFEPIDLPRIMLVHMGKCNTELMIQKRHALPYARLAKLLLQKFGVYKPVHEVTLSWDMNMTDIRKMKCRDDPQEQPELPLEVKPKPVKGESSKGGSVQQQMLDELRQISGGIAQIVSTQEQLVKIMQLILENALADVDPPPAPK